MQMLGRSSISLLLLALPCVVLSEDVGEEQGLDAMFSFEAMDQNSDGKVTKQEILKSRAAAMIQEEAGEDEEKIAHVEKVKAKLTEVFAASDANKDGKLNKGEYDDLAERFKNSREDEEENSEMEDGGADIGDTLGFDVMDKDSDGKVTEEEVKTSQAAAMIQQSLGNDEGAAAHMEEVKGKLHKIFGNFDNNKDGGLDVKEYAAFVEAAQKDLTK